MLLSDLLTAALLLYIVWHRFREGYEKQRIVRKKESKCPTARTQEDCVTSAGGTKNVCYWCPKIGKCIDGDTTMRGMMPPGCSSNYA